MNEEEKEKAKRTLVDFFKKFKIEDDFARVPHFLFSAFCEMAKVYLNREDESLHCYVSYPYVVFGVRKIFAFYGIKKEDLA